MPAARESCAHKFPALNVSILSLGMALNVYTLVSLFPYVGLMVKELLGLKTSNESGEAGVERAINRVSWSLGSSSHCCVVSHCCAVLLLCLRVVIE